MLEKVTERIYYLMNDNETERPALGLIIGDNCCLVVDAGNSPKHADEFLKEIKNMNLPPVRYVVATHHHWDHIFGLGQWDATTIASKKTCELAERYKAIKFDDESLDRAREKGIFNEYAIKGIKQEIENRDEFKLVDFNLVFQGELVIDLGGVSCHIKEMINPHREDGTSVYVPQEKTLFVGDAAYGCTVEGRNYYDRNKVQQMMDIVNSYDAEYCLCSHESICTKEEMKWYFNQINMGLEISKECITQDDRIRKFKQEYNREPDGNDLFFLESIYG